MGSEITEAVSLRGVCIVAGSMTTCLMTDFAACAKGTVPTATKKITFKSLTIKGQTLPVLMIPIQEKNTSKF